jgi:glycosyltransferase involved in cell wall biosynthesis
MNPSLLIPIYNHGATIGAVLDSLAYLDLPCLVVDDGSDADTRAELERLEARYEWVEVVHLARNGGRGVALRAGYRRAAELGRTHTVQLDADGQHDADAVPRFLEAAKANPEALVLGAPVFDSSAPRSRLWGRKLSQGPVWLETFSLAIRDPLCGLRCFPIGPTTRLLDRTRMGDRMDFDPEIAVRMVWAGVPVVNVPTKVVYHEGGLSHFAMFDDNARITWLHIRLVIGGLLRAPLLLARRWKRRG